MLQDPDLISIQEVRSKVEKAWAAAQKFAGFSQEQVDAVVERMAEAARNHAGRLAALAVEETGYGNAPDKTAKNRLAAERLPESLRGMKTVGVLRERAEDKVTEIAVPVGVVAAILPTTNPTSTAIYKTLIALKAGNSIVLSPHPRAKGCTCATAEVLYRAAVSAGAPDGIIQCVTQPTMEATHELMRHARTAVILSTGGSGIVKAAYSSGKPAFGVGPGNVPVLLDTSADIDAAIASILAGKTFDFGTLCSSEQTIVAERSLRNGVLAALQSQGTYVCDARQSEALTRVLFAKGTAVNPELVGHSALAIAQRAGFAVPESTRVLAAEIAGIGKDHPLSAEKLSPVLALYFVDNFASALDACEAILRFHGLGHTCGIYTKDEARAMEFARRMPAFRVLANTPTPQGSVGITTGLFPAMTLGCGAVAGNATGDNISPLHLINVKRLAWGIRPWADGAPRQVTASAAGPVDRTRIAAAVDRYLGAKSPNASASPVASVVDRFLASKNKPSESKPAATCPVPAARPPEPAPPATVDFVCEADVRQAIRESRKIYITGKSIVTPAARELANMQRDEILIVSQR
jgi:acetaldehyde dehydrogenase (acetylating)